MKNKFYVGHPKLLNNDVKGWKKGTLQIAIEHAKKLAEEQGQDQIVVQIVRVIRLNKPPITVEKV